MLKDADKELQHMLEYPFTDILASDEVSEVLEDDFPAVPATLCRTSQQLNQRTLFLSSISSPAICCGFLQGCVYNVLCLAHDF